MTRDRERPCSYRKWKRDLRVGAASHRDENPVVNFFLLLDVALEGHANSAALLFQGFDGGLEHDALKLFFEPFVQRQNQVAVGARKQSVKHFHYADAAAKRGVDRTHLQADIASTNHQQALRHLFKVEGSGRVHHSRALNG